MDPTSTQVEYRPTLRQIETATDGMATECRDVLSPIKIRETNYSLGQGSKRQPTGQHLVTIHLKTAFHQLARSKSAAAVTAWKSSGIRGVRRPWNVCRHLGASQEPGVPERSQSFPPAPQLGLLGAGYGHLPPRGLTVWRQGRSGITRLHINHGPRHRSRRPRLYQQLPDCLCGQLLTQPAHTHHRPPPVAAHGSPAAAERLHSPRQLQGRPRPLHEGGTVR